MDSGRAGRFLGISVRMVELDWDLSDERLLRRGNGRLSRVLVPHAFPRGALGRGICISAAGGLPEHSWHSSGGQTYFDVAAGYVGSSGGVYRDGISSGALQSVSSVFPYGQTVARSFRGWTGDCALVVCGLRTSFHGD